MQSRPLRFGLPRAHPPVLPVPHRRPELLASLISGQSVLPYAQNTDVYLASLGIILTSIYIFGLITRPQKRKARLGLDSWLVLLAYIIGSPAYSSFTITAADTR